jgi:hypothetical protein
MGSGQVNLLSGRIWRYRIGFGSATWCTPVSPLGRGASRLGRAVDSAQMPILNKKSFFFFKSVYKLQINLNSNQISISMTSTRTIKYKSTSSHQEKYAMVWMQQIIIYLNI